MAGQAWPESVAEGPAPIASAILEAVGLSRAFGPVEVLSDVSAAFRAGEAHAVIGENGAGKSTLMKILAGHLAPTRGTMRLDGEPVALRDGKRVATLPAAELEPLDMARLMVGRDLLALYPPRTPAPQAEPSLVVKGFDAPGFGEDAHFEVRPGEIVGFSGLVGAGRTELFEALFGLREGAGEIRLDGVAQRWRDARAAMRAGAVYLTEDRKGKGLPLEETLATNLTLAALAQFRRGPLVDRAEEAKARAKRSNPGFGDAAAFDWATIPTRWMASLRSPRRVN